MAAVCIESRELRAFGVELQDVWSDGDPVAQEVVGDSSAAGTIEGSQFGDYGQPPVSDDSTSAAIRLGSSESIGAELTGMSIAQQFSLSKMEPSLGFFNLLHDECVDRRAKFDSFSETQSKQLLDEESRALAVDRLPLAQTLRNAVRETQELGPIVMLLTVSSGLLFGILTAIIVGILCLLLAAWSPSR